MLSVAFGQGSPLSYHSKTDDLLAIRFTLIKINENFAVGVVRHSMSPSPSWMSDLGSSLLCSHLALQITAFITSVGVAAWNCSGSQLHNHYRVTRS